GQDFGRLCKERLAGENTVGCFIFEAGYLDDGRAHVVVARKGMATYMVEVEGRAAHAGTAHQNGANAIVQLAELVQKVASFTDYERELTFNVGTIAGGSVINRVPHAASAKVEMRAYTMDAFEEGLAKMLGLANETTVGSANGGYTCRASVRVMRRTEPWPRNAQTDRLFSVWQQAGKQLGLTVVPEQRGGLSDGNYFWHEIPSLDALGPSGGNAHCSESSADGSKEQEYVSRNSLVPKAVLNTLALLMLLDARTTGDGR
ncbi:MAG TPA: M20/M25/M40 family metallo-hydrolase, partial [Candidatus Binatia bacterium]|nr:M20/M25/M40 family metallo-hydrolase [Candidatus Binatia bacterium]